MSPELDIDRVRGFLERARILEERSARQSLDDELAPARRARTLCRRTHEILGRHTAALATDVARHLERYEGLPVTSNLIVATGKVDSELVHSSLLRWLLDPTEDHGLGDGMLRQILLRHPNPVGQQVAAGDAPLRAVVATEVPIAEGRVDIVGVLPELLFFIEVKVNAAEDRRQCESYRIGFENPGNRDLALRSMGCEPRGRLKLPVLGFFLRRRGRPESDDKGGTTNLDWLEVEEALCLSERRSHLSPGAAHAIRSVRSLLLEYSGADRSPMPTIQNLRRLLTLPNATGRDPLETLLAFRDYLKSIETSHE